MEQAKKSVENLKQVVDETDVTEDQDQKALDDISEHIDRFQEDPETQHHTLRARLNTAVTEFDVGHHQLLESIQETILALNVSGV